MNSEGILLPKCTFILLYVILLKESFCISEIAALQIFVRIRIRHSFYCADATQDFIFKCHAHSKCACKVTGMAFVDRLWTMHKDEQLCILSLYHV